MVVVFEKTRPNYFTKPVPAVKTVWIFCVFPNELLIVLKE